MKSIKIPVNSKDNLAFFRFETGLEAKASLIIAHGFRGGKDNAGEIFEFAYRLNELGLNVLAFDFRGCGESEGDFSEITLSRNIEDCKVMIDYAEKEFAKPLFLLGRSLGGSTVLASGAADDRVKAIILWSAPVLMQQAFENILGKDLNELRKKGKVKLKDDKGKFWLKDNIWKDFENHDMEEYLLKMGDKPLLVIHGKKDESVALENALWIEKKYPKAKVFLIENADHRFTALTKIRENISLNWLKNDVLPDLE